MFEINDRISHLIKLQRTFLKKAPPEDIQKLYYNSCLLDLQTFIKYLPKNAENILDIGSGMGGTDIVMFRHFKGIPKLVLLDADRVDTEIQYGFSTKPSAYSVKRDVSNFMRMNSVPDDKFLCVKAFPASSYKFDIMMSLISCGFHYPLNTYLQQMAEGLSNNGVLILDIRKKAGQFDQLHDHFPYVDTIQNNEKYKRVVCRNQK